MSPVGKPDFGPYNLAGTGGIDDRNVCQRYGWLRDRTRGLTGDDEFLHAAVAATSTTSFPEALISVSYNH
ncbi:MAG: hypothetical protein ACQET5_04750 [Halobacteriota archaeon]|uniref:hypothetical protein n=1 Tax=Natronomonas sp. TaxID=2184060 RepID=UPI003976E50E